MITELLIKFTSGLSGTGLTAAVASHFWVVPTLQTLHILSVAVVLSGVLIINLRIVGIVERKQPVSYVLDRFLKPTAIALLVLAITGVLLIAGEPTRAIFRTMFWLKMALIVLAVSLTRSHREVPFLSAGGSLAVSPLRKGIAITALVLWLAAIVAGRWIAYVDAWPGAPA